MMTNINKSLHKFKSTNPDCFDDKSYPSSKERSDELNSKFRENSPVPNLVSVENNSYEEETFISHNNLVSELIEENFIKLWENIRDLNEEIRIHSYNSNVKETIIEKSNEIATSVKFLFRVPKENTEMNEQNKIKKINVGIQVFPPLDYGPPVIPRRPTVNPQSTPDLYLMPFNVIMKSLPKQLYAQVLDERPQSPKKSLNSKTFELRDNISYENKEQIPQLKSILLKHPYEEQIAKHIYKDKVIQSRRKEKNYSAPISISRNQDNIPHGSKEQIQPLNIINHPYKQFPESTKENQPMKKINRSGAIVIIPIGREVKKNMDFKDVCKMVFSKAKAKLNCTTKIRKTQDGYLLIQLKKNTNAFKIATEIQTIVGNDFKVKPLVDKMFIEIRDLIP
ncbi:hypothetical protein K0M31_001881 [Melipona bicolor]|uniref:Uncharacterized protein n=1 Tax=Melipona bicolor TaxID=60889 RepID=A0AA40GGQ5_9HYME|nr:hypothetical protein K0M31_001881 [Melipona bicolor]